MRRIAKTLAFLAGLLPAVVFAQPFPQNLPANTFYGRLGTGTGPGQAIPFSYLISLNFLTNLCTTSGAFAVYNGTAGSWGCSAAIGTTRTTTASAASSDCWGTVPLGGTAFYTFTVGAATGFPVGCVMAIRNVDSGSGGRGKLLDINGALGGKCILWPTQEVVIKRVSTGWQWGGCYRWQIPVGITFNVNPSTGVDWDPSGAVTYNDCLGTGSGACKHISAPVNMGKQFIDAAGGAITIQLADSALYGTQETATAMDNFVCFGPQPGANIEVKIKGNVTTETNVVWKASADGATVVYAKDGCILGIDGVTFDGNSKTGAVAVSSGQGSTVDVGITGSGKVRFNAFTSGYDFIVYPEGTVNLTTGTTVTVAGNAKDFVLINSGGTFAIPSNFTVTFSGSPTLTNIFEVFGGVVTLGSSVTFSGAVTARRYAIDGGTLICNGNTLPGTGGSLVGGWIDCPASPSIASGACGTGSNGTISGSDRSGTISIGAAATTTCTITFSATQVTAPNACLIFPGDAGAAATATTVARVGAPSTTQWVITGSALASTTYRYQCL